ncbi:MAG: hypothetical protein QM644_06210 [Mobilitalea sp.]
MKVRSRIMIVFIGVLTIIIVLISGFFIQRCVRELLADKTWITDLGYEDNEIHNLTFDSFGNRSCPEVPIQVDDNSFKLTFDTGCGAGVQFTDVVEHKFDYTLLNEI